MLKNVSAAVRREKQMFFFSVRAVVLFYHYLFIINFSQSIFPSTDVKIKIVTFIIVYDRWTCGVLAPTGTSSNDYGARHSARVRRITWWKCTSSGD